MLTNLTIIHKEPEPQRIESLPCWQQAIISSIKSLRFAAGLDHCEWNRFNRKAVLSLRPYIPYLIHGTNKADVFILVNRDYKPIGLNWFPMVDYLQYPNMHLSSKDVAIIKPHYYQYQGWDGSVDGNFFMDDSSPWISKIHTSNLVARLERIIQDLNPGTELLCTYY
jgi:hypothetical protein